jgi:hypothetical protein
MGYNLCMQDELDPLQPHCPRWNKALVAICTKCCEGAGLPLAETLKEQLKAEYPDQSVKICKSGCLGMCPEKRVSVVMTSPTQPAQAYLADPTDHAVLDCIKHKIKDMN